MGPRGPNCLRGKANEIVFVVKILYMYCKTRRPYRALLKADIAVPIGDRYLVILAVGPVTC